MNFLDYKNNKCEPLVAHIFGSGSEPLMNFDCIIIIVSGGADDLYVYVVTWLDPRHVLVTCWSCVGHVLVTCCPRVAHRYRHSGRSHLHPNRMTYRIDIVDPGSLNYGLKKGLSWYFLWNLNWKVTKAFVPKPKRKEVVQSGTGIHNQSYFTIEEAIITKSEVGRDWFAFW